MASIYFLDCRSRLPLPGVSLARRHSIAVIDDESSSAYRAESSRRPIGVVPRRRMDLFRNNIKFEDDETVNLPVRTVGIIKFQYSSDSSNGHSYTSLAYTQEVIVIPV